MTKGNVTFWTSFLSIMCAILVTPIIAQELAEAFGPMPWRAWQISLLLFASFAPWVSITFTGLWLYDRVPYTRPEGNRS